MGLDALALALREQEDVSAADVERISGVMHRRMAGESVARIIGEREFYGLPFRLGPATLEPRPETELLVDLAISRLTKGGHLLDLGTGTGCIPISILSNRPDATGMATDLSTEALAVAEGNADRNGVAERLSFAQGNWFEALSAERRFDLIVSNPPYITSAVVETLAPEVKDYDPRLALDGGPDGLAPYRVIAAESARWLKPDGGLLLEIGYDQGAAVADLLAQHGWTGIAVHKDLNGLDRVVMAHHLNCN
jgi:release factor glutamine methyltransferase